MIKKTILFEHYHIKGKLPLNYDKIEGKENFIWKEYSYGPTYLCEIKNVYVTPYGVAMKKYANSKGVNLLYVSEK